MSDGKLKWEGDDDLIAELTVLQGLAPAAFAAALWQGGMDIQRRASTKIPVDTGTLRRSWVVDAPRISNGDVTCNMGYGTHYAIFVHEMTEVSHDTGEAKFLQKAIQEEATRFLPKLAKRGWANLKNKKALAPKKASGPSYNGGVE